MKYEIKGETMPVVICEVDAGETVVCESGSMSWMTPNMEMQTSGGGFGKMFGRMLSGENMMQNRYTAKNDRGMIAFASSFPGKIIPVEITPSSPIICQKRAFLAATEGVELNVHFQKKIIGGLFGGEGFVDTGYLAMMDESVSMDIQQVKGFKNVMMGGEGLFNTVVTGPGRVILQTMPVSHIAGIIAQLIPGKN